MDDEAQIRNLTAVILRRDGYEVLLARDGEEALAISRGRSGSIHLLLTDIEMPGMSGIDLAKQFTSERTGAGILLNSGNGAHAAQGGFPFLLKPFSPESLRIAVAREIEHSQPAVAAKLVEIIGPSPKRPLPRGIPLWACAAALAMVLVPLGLYQARQRLPAARVTVDLRASRGTGSRVEKNKSLLLRMDVSGLDRYQFYHVDLVDEVGRSVWQKAVELQDSVLHVVSNGLPPGIYFIRLSAPDGKPLREFGLTVVDKF